MKLLGDVSYIRDIFDNMTFNLVILIKPGDIYSQVYGKEISRFPRSNCTIFA